MESRWLSFLFLVLSSPSITRSLEFTPGSSCAPQCMAASGGDPFNPDSSSTNASEISCRDIDFFSTNRGQKFTECLECLQKSKKVNGTESDAKWFIYNLRYALTTCLYSSPKAAAGKKVDSPCLIDHGCGPLEAALTSDDLEADPDTAWDYCSADNKKFQGWNQGSCTTCLQSTSDQIYLGNFMMALKSACNAKPGKGDLVSLSGSVFSNKAINATEPAEDIKDKPAGAGSSTMTTGTIVGIAVGGGLLVLSIIALFCIYWRRQKRLKRQGRTISLQSHSTTPDPFLPPYGAAMSQSIRSFSRTGYRDAAQPPMSSGEYYDSVEREMQMPKKNYAFDPRTVNRHPNSALPAHQAYKALAVSRSEGRPSPRSTPRASPKRLPTPPDEVERQRHARSNTSDSFTLQTYLRSSDDINPDIRAPPVSRHTPSPERRPAVPAPPPPPPPQRQRSRKAPFISLPSVPRIRVPKQYSPPSVNITEATPLNEDHHDDRMGISDPVMQGSDSERFTDRPLGGPPVMADERPPTQLEVHPEVYDEIPIQSGKTRLFGS